MAIDEIDKLFKEVKECSQMSEYDRRKEARLYSGKSKAKEWIQLRKIPLYVEEDVFDVKITEMLREETSYLQKILHIKPSIIKIGEDDYKPVYYGSDEPGGFKLIKKIEHHDVITIDEIRDTIKSVKPDYIDKEIKPFPLNPYYYVSDKGYVFRLHTWDKMLNKDELCSNYKFIYNQLSVIDKNTQQKIYIGFRMIPKAKAFGYKVFKDIDKNNNPHCYITINNEVLKRCCFEEKMIPFEDKRTNKHLRKSVHLYDSDGKLYAFGSQKECYDKMFSSIISEKTFKRAIKKAKETGELIIKKETYIFG